MFGFQPRTDPVTGSTSAAPQRVVVLTRPNVPPIKRLPSWGSRARTGPVVSARNPVAVPDAAEMAVRFIRAAPPTLVNVPPTYTVEPSGDPAMDWTVPLLFGFQGSSSPVVASRAASRFRCP